MMLRSEALTTFNCNSLLKVKDWLFLGTLFAIKNNMPPTVSISCSESNVIFIPKIGVIATAYTLIASALVYNLLTIIVSRDFWIGKFQL